MTLLSNRKLAIAESVPKFNCLVSTSRNNLSVVRTEGDAEDIVCVADETAGSLAGVQVPQTEGLVP